LRPIAVLLKLLLRFVAKIAGARFGRHMRFPLNLEVCGVSLGRVGSIEQFYLVRLRTLLALNEVEANKIAFIQPFAALDYDRMW
jgi:hypothetical protein